MGTWVQAIIDRETATPEQARELGAAMLAWLVDKRIVEDRQCGADFRGNPCYPAGSAVGLVCRGSEHADRDNDYSPFSLRMYLVARRHFLHSSQARFTTLPCPECGADADAQSYLDAGFAWMLEDGPDALACPSCGTARPLREWEDPESGFMMLGFEFEDWPTFSSEFVDEFSRRLGHRVTYFNGKR
ncbi:MAG TPA: hypothetical protein VF774_29035 [Pseudoduganella sp.]|jgi:hypothetical protein